MNVIDQLKDIADSYFNAYLPDGREIPVFEFNRFQMMFNLQLPTDSPCSCMLKTKEGDLFLLVVMTSEVVKQLTPMEYTAILWHELGHIMNGDIHEDTGFNRRVFDLEVAADRVAVEYATLDGLTSALNKVVQINKISRDGINEIRMRIRALI